MTEFKLGQIVLVRADNVQPKPFDDRLCAS